MQIQARIFLRVISRLRNNWRGITLRRFRSSRRSRKESSFICDGSCWWKSDGELFLLILMMPEIIQQIIAKDRAETRESLATLRTKQRRREAVHLSPHKLTALDRCLGLDDAHLPATKFRCDACVQSRSADRKLMCRWSSNVPGFLGYALIKWQWKTNCHKFLHNLYGRFRNKIQLQAVFVLWHSDRMFDSGR